jgi:hypothetical protein
MENHISLLPDFSDRSLSYAQVCSTSHTRIIPTYKYQLSFFTVCLLQTHFWYLMKLVFPRYLCFDYGYACIPTIHSILDFRNLFSVASYSVIIFTILHALRTKRPRLLFALALTLLPFLPAANIFFPVGTVLAERLLFIPSMGFCLYVADILCEDLFPFWEQITEVFIGDLDKGQSISSPYISRMENKEKDKIISLSSINIALLVVLTLFGIRVVSRNADWISEIKIYRSALSVCPTSVKALSNYAMLKLGEDKENSLEVSLAHSLRALIVHPEQPSAFVNAGIAFTRLRRSMMGVHHFERFYAAHVSVIARLFLSMYLHHIFILGRLNYDPMTRSLWDISLCRILTGACSLLKM